MKRKVVAIILIIATMSIGVGCSPKTQETASTSSTPSTTQPASSTSPQTTQAAALEWDPQPQLGLIKGDYYKIEERFFDGTHNEEHFGIGQLGVLEAVQQDGKLAYVQFNEITTPNYYNRMYQNTSKRLSDYNFFMGNKKGVAWIQSVLKIEKEMLEKQDLSAQYDAISGASNSINNSMLPLAKKLSETVKAPSNEKMYYYAEPVGGGLTGVLKVIVKDGKITSCFYDEIFANTPDEIELERFKPFYRQSKYFSLQYDEPSWSGFNKQMDALNEKVVASQDMLNVDGLLGTTEVGTKGQRNYGERNPAYDNYLKFAEKLQTEMKNDGVLN